MSRLRKRHVDALRELTEDIERMDFIEKYLALVSFTDGHWYCFLNNDQHCAHSGDQPTARQAIDVCRATVQQQIEEARSLARWKERWGKAK